MSETTQVLGIPWCASASLIEQVDKRVLVMVRDIGGHIKHVIGILRSFDHFGTIVLEESLERIVIDGMVAEKKRGLCVIRGENVIMLGEMDELKDSTLLASLKPAEFKELAKIEQQKFQSESAATKIAEPFDDL